MGSHIHFSTLLYYEDAKRQNEMVEQIKLTNTIPGVDVPMFVKVVGDYATSENLYREPNKDHCPVMVAGTAKGSLRFILSFEQLAADGLIVHMTYADWQYDSHAVFKRSPGEDFDQGYEIVEHGS